MDRARGKEKREIDVARRELEEMQNRSRRTPAMLSADVYDDAELLAAFRLAGGLIRVMLR
jgi:hypothetical protein